MDEKRDLKRTFVICRIFIKFDEVLNTSKRPLGNFAPENDAIQMEMLIIVLIFCKLGFLDHSNSRLQKNSA